MTSCVYDASKYTIACQSKGALQCINTKGIIISTMDMVICPNCGKKVEISQAFKLAIENDIRESEQTKHKKDLEKLKKEIEEKTEKRLLEDLEFRIKDSENELKEAKEKNRELHNQLLEMSKSIREIKEQNDRKELENQKKLNEELEIAKAELNKTISEKARLKELELEKKLSDTQKALDQAQRKTRQGSGQLQGEVVELDLETNLKSFFILDEFSPIPKGIEGADIWQKVRNKHEQTAGSILWETKRTKAFSNSWLSKLREDTRKINATASILVTEVLPDGIKHFGRSQGVWITSYDHAILLAGVLRDSILQVAIAKSSASHKDDKLQEIYEYISSEAFRHKFESHFESVKVLRDDLESERRAMERIWKKREIQIQRLDRSASQMFGEFQGIIPSLKSIKNLELSSETSAE